jgi:small subunit ribosomal protein S8e
VKGCIIQIDATPFRQWYEAHYAQPVTKKGKSTIPTDAEPKKLSNHAQRSLDEKKKESKVDPLLESQFAAGRLYASISSRPGQSGRADGYILEGKELEVRLLLDPSQQQYSQASQFYLRKLRAGKHK